jgi:hypothetical protein
MTDPHGADIRLISETLYFQEPALAVPLGRLAFPL